MSTTEQFLRYLADRARRLKTEQWYWSYDTWRVLNGHKEGNAYWRRDR